MDFQQFITTVGAADTAGNSGSLPPTPESVVRSANFGTVDPTGASGLFLETAASAFFTFAGSWTLTMFVKPNFLETAEIAVNPRGVISKGNADAAVTFVLGVYVQRTGVDLGRARVFFSDGVSTISVASTANGSIANNTWHFIEASYNAGTDVLSINVDRGTPATTGTVASNLLGISDKTVVGGTFGTGINDFSGSISMVGIVEAVLTTEQLDELYNDGLGILFADIEAPGNLTYYQLDELSTGAGSVPREDAATLADDLLDPDNIPSSTAVPS